MRSIRRVSKIFFALGNDGNAGVDAMKLYFALGREGRWPEVNEKVRLFFAAQARGDGAPRDDEAMKQGIKLYLAGIDGSGPNPAALLAHEHAPIQELSILASYFYFKKWTVKRIKQRYEGVPVTIFADSGGFSGMSLNQHVRLKDYITWIQENKEDIAFYANLDSIGDPIKTRRNQRIMEGEGLKPIPVFHVNSDWKYLEEMIADGAKYIALGGMVPYLKGHSKSALGNWVRHAFERLGDCKVHGFGVGTTWDIAKFFPWASIDSSSWTSVFQFRQLALFDEKKANYIPIDLGSESKDIFKHAALLKLYGFTPGDFYPPQRYSYVKAGALSVMSVLRAEAWLRKHGGEGWRARLQKKK